MPYKAQAKTSVIQIAWTKIESQGVLLPQLLPLECALQPPY